MQYDFDADRYYNIDGIEKWYFDCGRRSLLISKPENMKKIYNVTMFDEMGHTISDARTESIKDGVPYHEAKYLPYDVWSEHTYLDGLKTYPDPFDKRKHEISKWFDASHFCSYTKNEQEVFEWIIPGKDNFALIGVGEKYSGLIGENKESTLYSVRIYKIQRKSIYKEKFIYKDFVKAKNNLSFDEVLDLVEEIK